jgi:hypothetical protein
LRSWRRGVGADLGTQRGFGFWASKGCVDGRQRQLDHAVLIEVQQPSCDRVLGVQVGANHRRIVGVDRDRDAGRDQLADRMMIKVGHHP